MNKANIIPGWSCCLCKKNFIQEEQPEGWIVFKRSALNSCICEECMDKIQGKEE